MMNCFHEYESSKIQSGKWLEFLNRQTVKIRDRKGNSLWIQGNLKDIAIFLIGNILEDMLRLFQ